MIIAFLYSFQRRQSWSISGFSSVLFQEKATLRHRTPSKTSGIDIELPDFDELFGRIQLVSPLAKSVIETEQHNDLGVPKGFGAIDDTSKCNFPPYCYSIHVSLSYPSNEKPMS